jgi:hypothetical protein
MLVNIGIIHSIGTALRQKRTNLLDNLKTLLSEDGEQLINSLKNSQVKLLLTSVQDGPGLLNKATIWLLSIHQMLVILLQAIINLY